MMKQAARKHSWRPVLILFILALLVKLLSLNSGFIEHYYAGGFYIFISHLLRVVFGWLPFSIGDILYAVSVIWLLVLLVRFIGLLVKRKLTTQKFGYGFRRLLRFLLLVYLIFNIFWGLNYNREGIAYQLHLQPQPETKDELISLTSELIQKVNSARRHLPAQVQYLSYNESFDKAVTAYQNAERKYPFLKYQFRSVKPSVYSLPGNYLGYSGYYNPFTAEAQVNVRMLPFTTPYVTCHEMAHQLGYASEDEANFVGYLAARSSPDLQFQYSVYFDLFNYANSELYSYDSLASKANYRQLDTLVKKDIKTYRLFWQKYDNAMEPIITALYGNYLKANNQPAGIRTYDRVTMWLIAYREKYKDL